MRQPDTRRTLRLQILFVALCATVALLACALYWGHERLVPPIDPQAVKLLLVGTAQADVLPEAAERFTFTLLAAALPLLAWLFSAQWRSWPASPRMDARAGWLLSAALALAFYLTFASGELAALLLAPRGQPAVVGVLAAMLAALAGLAWSLAASRDLGGKAFAARVSLRAVVVLLLALAAMTLAWRIPLVAELPVRSGWVFHADPLLYVLSQVHAGRSVLAQLPSQYGLYPEMLAPLFRVTGLGATVMGVVFAVLQLLSLGMLFAVLARAVKSRSVLVAAGLALLLVTYETTMHFAGLDDPYYQYWPLRAFWPMAAVLAFQAVSARPTPMGCAAMGVLGGLAALWNLDTGVVVVLAFSGWLAMRCMAATGGRKRWALALLLHGAAAAGAYALGLGFLALKAGGPLHLAWLVEYQRIFAVAGLMMLPLPRTPHAWMGVVGIYAAALLLACTGWRRAGAGIGGRQARDADLYFFIALLGIGLFAYYAARSHAINLVKVLWPAVMLVALMTDRTLRAVRGRLLPRQTLALAAAGCAALVLMAGSFAARIPLLVDDIAQRPALRGPLGTSMGLENLAFIRQLAPPGTQCLILSHMQGFYHAETQVVSPLPGPGLTELLLQADQDRLVAAVRGGTIDCLFLGLGPIAPPIALRMEELEAAYLLEAANPAGSMLLLRGRRAATAGPATP